MKRGLKVERRRKKVKNLEKKTSNFFLFMRFYLERRNVTDKKGLFYAKFFEFEEFFHPSFFLGSIQPQHAVLWPAGCREVFNTKSDAKYLSFRRRGNRLTM
jgi:hypothetical protein